MSSTEGLTRILAGTETGYPSAVQEIAAAPVAPYLNGRINTESKHCKTNFERLHRLSSSEQVVLRCLTQGASNKSIARELNMAEATVKVHIKGILRKIRVSNRKQAAVQTRASRVSARPGNRVDVTFAAAFST
jgi:DNA-binding NarL/FixJ family response regulator